MHPDLLDRDTAVALSEALVAVEGVVSLDGGHFGEVAMLFPGVRVRGIHVAEPHTDDGTRRLEVNIVADAAKLPNLEKLAADVRDVAARYVDVPVDVTVADVA